MRKPRGSLLWAGFLVAAVLLQSACSSQPAPVQTPQSPGQSTTIQQQAGYGQPVPYASGAYPGMAPSATAPFGDSMLPSTDPLSWANTNPPPDAATAQIRLEGAEQILTMMFGNDELRSADANQKTPRATALGSDPTCSIACSALASMRRSADHLCAMSDEGESTCQNARARVERATARVTAFCPACAQ